MRLFLLSFLTLLAFAANSVLNRAAVGTLGMDPLEFGAIRLASGAVALGLLILWTKRGFAFGGLGRLFGVAGLLVYIFGFTLAYQSLDAGLGALILFGVVQITMFGGAVVIQEPLPIMRWIGAGFALAGLTWLLWPGGDISISLLHAILMVGAGIGWGVYSVQGRSETDATQATGMNFMLAAPIAVVAALVVPSSGDLSASGVLLALASGILSSGMGYALWYQIIPALGAGRAAVAQLSVPILAMGGGMLFLSEPLTFRFMVAAALVVCGVLISIRR
ncbi:MAG: DMT family transporter [Paracoccaceae bacterium]|nr:DMT family transporter [Paracoccaceae bacterium]MDG2259740.1 DMT family transporter [Paracoccaceae bacterium]